MKDSYRYNLWVLALITVIISIVIINNLMSKEEIKALIILVFCGEIIIIGVIEILKRK